MRRFQALYAFVILICGLCTVLQVSAAKTTEGSQFTGVWIGTWEGSGSGRFELTLQTEADGAITGGVSVGTDAGDYTARFKNPVFAGNKLTATYDYPLDEQGEIALNATFESSDATGTWALGPKGLAATNSIAAGTFQVKKK